MIVEKAAPQKRKKKTLRLPNGFGSISYLGQNRRKPYIARIYDHTEMHEDTMTTTAVYKSLGTFRTWDEAFLALAKYNENPYDIDASHITFREMYERWLPEYANTPINGRMPSTSAVKGYKVAYAHCRKLYDMEIRAIKPLLLQQIITDCDMSRSTQQAIIKLFNSVFKYAMRLEIVDRNPAQGVRCTKMQEQVGSVFTADEIRSLWAMESSVARDAFLVLLYTGMRIGELFGISADKIHEDYLIGGNKTEIGKDRVIPLHPRIREIAHSLLPMCVSERKLRMDLEQIFPNHIPHDCRKTFISRCYECGVNETAARKIVGHSGKDVHEKVYTRLSKDYLLEEISKIEY